MSEITASAVKELRERTGAGMMDCKKALVETDGDAEAAIDWLRTKGLAAAAKRAGRIATEGLVGISVSGDRGALVEINSETDFVARNDKFQAFVNTVTGLAAEAGGDLEALKKAAFPDSGGTVEEELVGLISTIGENLTLRRTATLGVGSGVVASYIHNRMAPGLGRIGVLVALESEGDPGGLDELGRNLAMQVAASSPLAVSREGVDPTLLERERGMLAEQARASGKPEEIVEKMVEGRLRKFYEEVCLLDQTYVIDGESKVSKVIEAAAKEAGAPIEVKGFERFAIGEGVEGNG